MSDVDIHELQRWVGRETVATQWLDPFPARALAAMLDHDRSLDVGDALPLPWHWLYFLETPLQSRTGEDGHALRGGFLPPVPLPRRMWAAGAVQRHAPLRIRAMAEKTSTIKSVESKAGKSGALVFVNVEHTLRQGGDICLVEAQSIVYRDLPAGPAPLPAGEAAPTDADWRAKIQPDPVLLFRYSALTFNGHRIHYDRDYAVRQEFYPALVVHGPLLATLLLDLLTRHVHDADVAEFRFRAVRPSFDTAEIGLCARRNGKSVELWTTDPQGFVGMTAQATLR